MLVVSNHHLLFHLFQRNFQDYQFCDLTRRGGEADWLVITFSNEFRYLVKDWAEKVFFVPVFTMICGPSICDMEVSKHQMLLSFRFRMWDYILQIGLHCTGLNLVLHFKYISLFLYGNTSVQN